MNRFAANRRLVDCIRWGGLCIRTYKEALDWFDSITPVRGRMHRGRPWLRRDYKAAMFHDRKTGAVSFYSWYAMSFYSSGGKISVQECQSIPLVAYPDGTWVMDGTLGGYNELKKTIKALWGYDTRETYRRSTDENIPNSILWVHNTDRWYAIDPNMKTVWKMRKGVLVPDKSIKVTVPRVITSRANQLYKARKDRMRILVGRFKLMNPEAAVSPSPSNMDSLVKYLEGSVVEEFLLWNWESTKPEHISAKDMEYLVRGVQASLATYRHFIYEPLTPARFEAGLRYLIREYRTKYVYKRMEVTDPAQFRIYKF